MHASSSSKPRRRAATKATGFANADVAKATGVAEAEANKARGLAEAAVIEAQGKATAEAMRVKAESSFLRRLSSRGLFDRGLR